MGELYRKPQMLLRKPSGRLRTSSSKLYIISIHFSLEELDDFYRDFPQQWEYCDQHNEIPERKSIGEDSVKNNTMKDRIQRATFCEENMGDAFLQNTSKGEILAQKMKELEMMDEEDLDQMLDIKEVLYYYSHLKCPVYLDIVDRYFTDMYNELSLPQTFINVNSSINF
ncbi:hypothetical protein HAX54_017931 [Datura stramonium]|uniref:Uncharacterized protein n=1 Tax=Datura stramonium TaxID=4076 RepID=A0ABS8RJ81_DATST|nr:hypothetical protein [Datura stramonium]